VSTFQRKNGILPQVWKDKREVTMISTIHSANIIQAGKKTGKQEMLKIFVSVFEKYNPSISIVYKNFHHEATRDWILEKGKEGSMSIKNQFADHLYIPREPKKTQLDCQQT
jgi:hypothetical protein